MEIPALNGAFWHLALNHIPVIAVPFAFLLLLGGRLKKSAEIEKAALVALVVIALLTIVVWKTGGPAAHTIKGLPGVERSFIHEHAQAADRAFWSMEVLGLLALIGLFVSRRSELVPEGLTILLLVIAFVLSVGFAAVAHLGGMIRHTEVRPGFTPVAVSTSPPAAAHP